jgi:hypothetical protein
MWKWQEDKEETKEVKLLMILKYSDKMSEDLIFVNTSTECGVGTMLMGQLKDAGIPCRPISYHYPLAPDHKSRREKIIHV